MLIATPAAAEESRAGGELLLTGGVSSIEGAAGGGLATWAVIGGDLVDHIQTDSRVSEILKGQDMARLRRLLKGAILLTFLMQVATIAADDAGIAQGMGTQTADVNALIENLQAAMHREHVGFFAQNQFLAKLAPMKRTTVKQ